QLQRIDLTYTSPLITNDENPTPRHAAFVATETLLGGQCLDQWIGAIETTPMLRKKGISSLFSRGVAKMPHFIELDRLKETVDALIISMQEQLPPTPHYDWVGDAQWSMWELKPKEADDYSEQDDLFVGKSANPSQWMAAHRDQLFSSNRFSR